MRKMFSKLFALAMCVFTIIVFNSSNVLAWGPEERNTFVTEDFTGKTMYYLNGVYTNMLFFRPDGIVEVTALAPHIRTSDYTWKVTDGKLILENTAIKELINVYTLLMDNHIDNRFIIKEMCIVTQERYINYNIRELIYDELTGYDQAINHVRGKR